MVLPFLAAAFVLWAVADVASYALTGEDTIFHFANWMGWTSPGVAGEGVTIVTGSSFADFFVNNWFFVCVILAVIFWAVWFSTSSIKEGGK